MRRERCSSIVRWGRRRLYSSENYFIFSFSSLSSIATSVSRLVKKNGSDWFFQWSEREAGPRVYQWQVQCHLQGWRWSEESNRLLFTVLLRVNYDRTDNGNSKWVPYTQTPSRRKNIREKERNCICRQDQLIMQMIRLMDMILKENQLDLKWVSFLDCFLSSLLLSSNRIP